MGEPVDAVSSAPASEHSQRSKNSALQNHVEFFDRDHDGIIWPTDTFVGMRELHFSLFWTIVAVLVIHGGFSYMTWGTWLPDPFFRLKIRLMHRAKHGSDSESYTTTGSFDENRFNSMFEMYSQPPHDRLSFLEGVRMLHGNMNPFDPFGWTAAIFEWWATYYMLWPKDGYVQKDDVRAIYDGSIFYRISDRKPTYAEVLKSHN